MQSHIIRFASKIAVTTDGEMGRWGDGEMGDGEMGRWGDGEMGRWGESRFLGFVVLIFVI
ncbi:hypothetical protein [Calothrix sp. UHCC 0171]|uniref:hypothetical protein n=1 Tax=Calothrix sp. UHCC 0171 TaxID=3110245 RepID=UPI002B215701|nr:hypothetical protein [Calothrix sp. UHCC 0171]MEA5569679.1 hypothetical protein [Calothrix sp. UHCC 0171]